MISEVERPEVKGVDRLPLLTSWMGCLSNVLAHSFTVSRSTKIYPPKSFFLNRENRSWTVRPGASVVFILLPSDLVVTFHDMDDPLMKVYSFPYTLLQR